MNVIEIKPTDRKVEIWSFKLEAIKKTDNYTLYLNEINQGRINRGDLRHLIEILDNYPIDNQELCLNGVKMGYMGKTNKDMVEYVDNVIHH